MHLPHIQQAIKALHDLYSEAGGVTGQRTTQASPADSAETTLFTTFMWGGRRYYGNLKLSVVREICDDNTRACAARMQLICKRLARAAPLGEPEKIEIDTPITTDGLLAEMRTILVLLRALMKEAGDVMSKIKEAQSGE